MLAAGSDWDALVARLVITRTPEQVTIAAPDGRALTWGPPASLPTMLESLRGAYLVGRLAI